MPGHATETGTYLWAGPGRATPLRAECRRQLAVAPETAPRPEGPGDRRLEPQASPGSRAHTPTRSEYPPEGWSHAGSCARCRDPQEPHFQDVRL